MKQQLDLFLKIGDYSVKFVLSNDKWLEYFREKYSHFIVGTLKGNVDFKLTIESRKITRKYR